MGDIVDVPKEIHQKQINECKKEFKLIDMKIPIGLIHSESPCPLSSFLRSPLSFPFISDEQIFLKMKLCNSGVV